MCGIAGFNWHDPSKVLKMVEALKHRGPDQSGHYADASVSLGHSRLSIIDLSERGRQPIANEDQSLWLVCNGEIYNHREIRRELDGRHVFSSDTDTEVLLHAYEEWGSECVRRLNGMWAFCLYDRKAQVLVLSRDRVGKKPLYFARDATRFIFASELKAILLAHAWERRISKEALDFFFSLGYIPSPWSIYEGIEKLEPRQVAVYDLGTQTLVKKSFYEIPRATPLRDRKRLVGEGKALLEDATRLRLTADVPVGAFLSGGLDSSSVVAAMAKEIDPTHLHTFSIGFEGAYDETGFMEIIREAFRTNHHHQYFTEKDFERTFNRLPYFYDEPFDDAASFATFDLSALARRYVTVCLSGDGGDEIFGGYKMHRRAARYAALQKIPSGVRRAFRKILRGARPETTFGRLRETLRVSLAPPEDFYAEAGWASRCQPDVVRTWSRRKMGEILEKTGGDLVQAVIFFDLFVHTLPDLFLVKVDRASMAHGLEVRCPFLDYRFLEFSARLPARWKANRRQSKILLRRIIRSMVPAVIARRKKKGFTPPVLEWIEKDRYRRFAAEAIETAFCSGILNRNWHDFFIGNVLSNDDGLSRMMRLRAIVFGQWWKTWMTGHTTEGNPGDSALR
jgi:asparagine synthase (glutamine-hydrolysing)